MFIDIGNFPGDNAVVHKNWEVVHNNVKVILKEDTSVTHPTFIMSGYDLKDLANCNGVYWGKQGRYYTVRDAIVSTGKRIELLCDVDVLKTFEKDIDNMTAYVSRQETEKAPFFIDENLPIKCRKSIETRTIATLPRNTTPTAKCVLITTSGA